MLAQGEMVIIIIETRTKKIEYSQKHIQKYIQKKRYEKYSKNLPKNQFNLRVEAKDRLARIDAYAAQGFGDLEKYVEY